MVIIPVVFALIIAASVAPIARAMSHRGWGSGRAAAVAVGGTFLLLIAMIVVAGIQVAGPIVDAAQAAIAGAGNSRTTPAATLPGWRRSPRPSEAT